MVLSGEPQKKSPVTAPGIDPGTVRLIVGCSCYILQFKPSINYKWQFWSCASVEFNEQYIGILLVVSVSDISFK